MTDEHIAMVREVFVDSLAELRFRLGDFEQTSHGSITRGTIFEVSECLVKAWQDPSAYNLSNLSQAIDALEDIQTEQSRLGRVFRGPM